MRFGLSKAWRIRGISISLITAALLFNNWSLAGFLNYHLLKLGSSVSEFSAQTQPHHLVFRVLDISAGFIFIFTASLLGSLNMRRNRSWRAIVGLCGLLGIAEIVDALIPMSCSGTVDANCTMPVRITPHNFSLPPHIYSSTIIGACVLLMPIIGYYLAKRAKRSYFKLASFLSVVTTLIFFALLFNASAKGYYTGSAAAGYSQEIQMVVFGIWLIYLARFAKDSTQPLAVE